MTTSSGVALPPARVGRRVVAGWLLTAVAAGAIGMLVLWWRAPTTHAITTTGDLLVNLGRASGMVAAYLILVTVFLMARVPWVERRVGTDLLASAHRWIGTYLSGLLAVHVVTVVLGYAAGMHRGVLDETGRLVLGYPYVLLAAIAVFLLAIVVGTSLRPVRRRLPYEVWQALHLLAYVAAGLAIAHEIVDGLQFVGHPLARQIWVEAHAVVLILVLRYRVVEPLRMWLRHDFRISTVTAEADGSVSVVVTGRDLNRLYVEPGQFFRWRFLIRGWWWEAHPFSLSHAPNGRWLRMTAKPIGDHTWRLDRLRPGVPVILEGPYGAVTPAQRRGRRMLLVGAGSGLAPLLSIAQAAVRHRLPVTLVYRVGSDADVCFRDEIEELSRAALATVRIVTGSRTDPQVLAFFRSELPRLLGYPRDVDVFVCGPDGFVAQVQAVAWTRGVPIANIHVESYVW